MSICFVIQPFDAAKFDRRFSETWKPALEDAGLDVYRVDEDPGAEIPIRAIEEKIHESVICLADISTDNPNVWYELGYAFAADKSVIMICSDERQGNFPFDIRHRKVIQYSTGSQSDYENLREKITASAKALLKKSESMKQVDDAEQVVLEKNVTKAEVIVLNRLASETAIPNSTISPFFLQGKIESIDHLGKKNFGLAVRRLLKRGFIETRKEVSVFDQETYDALILTPDGWEWIDQNHESFDPYDEMPF